MSNNTQTRELIVTLASDMPKDIIITRAIMGFKDVPTYTDVEGMFNFTANVKQFIEQTIISAVSDLGGFKVTKLEQARKELMNHIPAQLYLLVNRCAVGSSSEYTSEYRHKHLVLSLCLTVNDVVPA